VALAHGFRRLFVGSKYDNVASKKTILKLGARSITIADVSDDGVLDELKITDGSKGDRVSDDQSNAIAFFSQEVVLESPQIVGDGELIILGGAINRDKRNTVKKVIGVVGQDKEMLDFCSQLVEKVQKLETAMTKVEPYVDALIAAGELPDEMPVDAPKEIRKFIERDII